jgi:hypothetical protein
MTKFKNVGGGDHNLAGIGYLRAGDVFETSEVNAAFIKANTKDIYVEQSADAEVTFGINKHGFAPEVFAPAPEPVEGAKTDPVPPVDPVPAV